MPTMLRALQRELLYLVVPPLCGACREPDFSGAAVCPRCRSRLVALSGSRCARCGAPTSGAVVTCRECRGRALGFSTAWAPFSYEGVGRQVVAALKSRAGVAIATFMAEEIAARAPTELLGHPLVPVPAHRRRLRRHGFNHAEAIASRLGSRSSLPVRDVLERCGGSAPQVGLERRARLANARRSVRTKRTAKVPLRAVLIDDVYTTGATLGACARALRAEGAEEVLAVTFARAVRG
jgi:ComF family protein